MNINKFFFFVSCFLLGSNPGMSQTFQSTEYEFDQFFKNFYALNPAINDTSTRLNVQIGNRTITGLFEGITNFYGDINLVIPSQTSKTYQQTGIFALAGKEGEFFRRNRIYGRYAYRTVLFNKVSLSTGVSLGLVNYSIKSSPASGGGNSITPDITLGIWLLVDNIQFGVSLGQFLQNKLQPVDQVFFLNRFLNCNLNHNYRFSPNLSLSTFIYFRNEKLYPDILNISPILTWKNLFEGGFNFQHQKGISLVAGFKSIVIGKGNLRFMASYLISTRNVSYLGDYVLEFSMGYGFPFSKKK